jgi:hypothetical protein
MMWSIIAGTANYQAAQTRSGSLWEIDWNARSDGVGLDGEEAMYRVDLPAFVMARLLAASTTHYSH